MTQADLLWIDCILLKSLSLKLNFYKTEQKAAGRVFYCGQTLHMQLPNSKSEFEAVLFAPAVLAA